MKNFITRFTAIAVVFTFIITLASAQTSDRVITLDDKTPIVLNGDYTWNVMPSLNYTLTKEGAIRVFSNHGWQFAITTAQIGTQTWSTREASVQHLNDGTPIKQAKSAEEWKNLCDNLIPAWCYKNFDTVPVGTITGTTFYNAAAINTNRLAPPGYRVPNTNDWTTLINYYGGSDSATVKIKICGDLWSSLPSPDTQDECYTGDYFGASVTSMLVTIPTGTVNFLSNEVAAYWCANTPPTAYITVDAKDVSFSSYSKFTANATSKYQGNTVRFIKTGPAVK